MTARLTPDVVAGRVRALRAAERMNDYLRRTADNPLAADAAVQRAADKLRELGEGTVLDTVLCDECGTHTTDPETCPHGREHCPECRENGYACNACRGEADPRWNR